jgi:hypothetical protein
MDMKMTKSQKRIITVVGIIAAIFAVFTAFVYIPMASQLGKMKKEYARINSDIEQVKSMGGGKTLEKTISDLNARLDRLKVMFPSKEEGFLKTLSDTAAKFKIEIHTMNPEKKHIMMDMGGSPVIIKDCVVQEMSITVNMMTDFKTFSSFIKYLKDDCPVYLKADMVRMEKTSNDKHPQLNIDMKIHTYLICPK